jgi:hypothetical protein
MPSTAGVDFGTEAKQQQQQQQQQQHAASVSGALL